MQFRLPNMGFVSRLELNPQFQEAKRTRNEQLKLELLIRVSNTVRNGNFVW